MNNFYFSQRSLRALVGLHLDLQAVAQRAIKISTVDFVITEGLRSYSRQEQLVAEGKSQTLKSRHLTGHALDYVAYVDGKVTYDPVPMSAVAEAFKEAAKELGFKIVWGGDWKTFKDLPHIELDREQYPA
jgi:peptidoglycan L-alanyl-D-glutamate endopeptidase CwlK